MLMYNVCIRISNNFTWYIQASTYFSVNDEKTRRTGKEETTIHVLGRTRLEKLRLQQAIHKR